MPGFKFSGPKQNKFVTLVLGQACRVFPGAALIELCKREGEEVATVKTLSRCRDFFQEVLKEFPHGPPVQASLERALLLYSKSPDCMVAAQRSPTWARDEAEKIHMCWRFVWNCWKRSKNSRNYTMSRLKSTLDTYASESSSVSAPGAVVSDDECGDGSTDAYGGEWPTDDEAIMFTPVPAPTLPMNRARSLRPVLSISDSEEPVKPVKPTVLDLSTPLPAHVVPTFPPRDSHILPPPACGVELSPLPAVSAEHPPGTSRKPRAMKKSKGKKGGKKGKKKKAETTPSPKGKKEKAEKTPSPKGKKEKAEKTPSPQAVDNRTPAAKRKVSSAEGPTPMKKQKSKTDSPTVTCSPSAAPDPDLQRSIWLDVLKDVLKKCKIKRTPQATTGHVRTSKMCQRQSVIWQTTIKMGKGSKRMVWGQVTLGHFGEGNDTSERVAWFLDWVAKLGYTKKEWTEIREAVLEEPGRLSEN